MADGSGSGDDDGNGGGTVKTMTMTTDYMGEAWIYLGGSGTATIDWSDGSEPQSVSLQAYSRYDDYRHRNFYTYNNRATRTIVISGQNITYLGIVCDVGTLDVSRNPALTHLMCAHNLLTSLDVNKNGSLWHLSCVSNQLTTATLNDLFRSLPYKKTETEEYGGVIFISYRGMPEAGNPGNSDCDRSIATKKGWEFRAVR